MPLAQGTKPFTILPIKLLQALDGWSTDLQSTISFPFAKILVLKIFP